MENINLINGDCLELMKDIPDKSIDLILCDLPYGTTACSWDTIIPFDKLWEQYKRIIKDCCPIVLFSAQPFTSFLITSNIEWYKYNWVWEKDNATNFLSSHLQPMKITEDICVFGNGAITYSKKKNYITYYPQKTIGTPYKCKSGKSKANSAIVRGDMDRKLEVSGYLTENDGYRMPKNLIKFNRDKEKLHPTQKPIALLQYLIQTYSKEGNLVLDNCMGSGSTGVACIKTKRNFIGIELDEKYFNIAKKRIEIEKAQLTLF